MSSTDAITNQCTDWVGDGPRCFNPSAVTPVRQPPAAMPPERPWLPVCSRAVQSAHDQLGSHGQGRRTAMRPPREPPKATTCPDPGPQPPPEQPAANLTREGPRPYIERGKGEAGKWLMATTGARASSNPPETMFLPRAEGLDHEEAPAAARCMRGRMAELPPPRDATRGSSRAERRHPAARAQLGGSCPPPPLPPTHTHQRSTARGPPATRGAGCDAEALPEATAVDAIHRPASPPCRLVVS